MQNFCAAIFLLSFSVLANSQEIHPGFGHSNWFVAPQYGFIIPHTKQMEHLIQGHSFGLQAQWLFATGENQEWARAYNFPDRGIDFYISNTGNPTQLGIQMAASYLVNLPLNRKIHAPDGGSFRHWLGLGLGVGYSTKKWKLEENHQAAVLGSKLNTSIVLQYSSRVVKTAWMDLRGGVRITHFSNGAYKVPNLGTNNFCVFLGVIPLSKNSAAIPTGTGQPSPEPNGKKWIQSLAVSFGLKQIPPPLEKNYGTLSLSYLVDYRTSYKGTLSAGLDGFYNSSVRRLMERRDTTEHSVADATRVGVLIGGGLHFGKFEFKVQQGFYVRDEWKEDGALYHRFGLRYLSNEHWFINFMLKTHFAKADHGEWGIGYQF